jgi:hypothetical protein
VKGMNARSSSEVFIRRAIISLVKFSGLGIGDIDRNPGSP